MPAKSKDQRIPIGKYLLVGALFLGAFALGVSLVFWSARREQQRQPPLASKSGVTNTNTAVLATYGTSPTCKSCHAEAYQNWEHSHHALAERKLDAAQDKIAFDPPWQIKHGTQFSQTRITNNEFQLITQGLNGTNQPFDVKRVVGVNPLRQFLIPAGGGRFQASELCFDPAHPDWFDVFGDEDRKPGEWGHWTGRGMNWNNMCATCHNTRLRKNYDARSDSYSTTMAEMGVGCEACHGPMATHNEWQAKNPNKTGDPTVRKIAREEMFSACAQCHSRRAELTGDFYPPENFLDHHQLTIPDETDLFYPDGQVRDEDYELTAFLGSKMHAAGVRCVDCHEPHTSKLRVAGNLMCLTCHSGTIASTNNVLNTAPVGPRIDPETHSRHKVGTRGDFCTDCHMPQTVYMQRHARHDHGFTIPDPRLTKELGIPNACNRCHTERSADWSLEAMVKWYGPRTNEVVRTRAHAIAKARAGEDAAMPRLVTMARSETNALWRAAAANLLKRWASDPQVTAVLLSCAGDTNALVRAMAVRGLEPLARSSSAPVAAALQARLGDPVRAVRVESAWTLRHALQTNSVAGGDLLAYLLHNGDQPAGALQIGVFHLDRGDHATALDYFLRAVRWDNNSAPLHHALAVALSVEGKSTEAVDALQTASRLAPNEAEYRFKLGLALNEVGKLDEACAALEETVKLDPKFSQGWYNLGLAYSAQNKFEPALESLVRAESLDTQSPQIPYARATILARLGRASEARTAAHRALELRPSYAEAKELLQALNR